MSLSCSVAFCVGNKVGPESSIWTNALPGFDEAVLGDGLTYTLCKMMPYGQYVTIRNVTPKLEVVGCVGLVKHNLSSTAEWRIRVWTTDADRINGETPVYDSGWERVNRGLDEFGVLPWGSFNWGELSYEIYSGHYNRVSVHLVPELVIGSCVVVDVLDLEMFQGPGYVQAALLWVSEVWQPEFSASYGSSQSFHDKTNRIVAESRVTHTSKRLIKDRSMSLNLDLQDKKDFFYNFVGRVLSARGASMEGIVVLEPTQEDLMPFQTIYGTIADSSLTVSHTSFGRVSTTVDIKELI